MERPSDAKPMRDLSAWYRQPVLWVGMAFLLLSLVGCICMIVLGARHADPPLATERTILGVPEAPAASSQQTP